MKPHHKPKPSTQEASFRTAVASIYAAMDRGGVAYPCYLGPHRGNPKAKLLDDLRVGPIRRPLLLRAIARHAGVRLNGADVERCVTVGDLARLALPEMRRVA